MRRQEIRRGGGSQAWGDVLRARRVGKESEGGDCCLSLNRRVPEVVKEAAAAAVAEGRLERACACVALSLL